MISSATEQTDSINLPLCTHHLLNYFLYKGGYYNTSLHYGGPFTRLKCCLESQPSWVL